MNQFQDIYMRDYVGDSGQVPSDVRQGVSASPDIIPWGASPNPNYQTDLVNNYNVPSGYFQNINPLGYNYIYVRGFNAFPSSQSGSINLYYAPASLLLWPPRWQSNVIQNTNNTGAAVIPSTPINSVCVGQGAFYWKPPTNLASGDHFCLISQVVTQQDPNVFPTTLADFAQWVANNANIAWRNVTLVPQKSPRYSAFVEMTNPVEQPNTFTLTATCTGVPDGTVVSLVGSEAAPSINFAGTVGPSNCTGSDPKVNQFGWTVFSVPGSFSEAIQLTATSPPGGRGVGSIRYDCYWLVEKSHPLAALGVDPAEFNMHLTEPDVAADGMMLAMGNYTFQY